MSLMGLMWSLTSLSQPPNSTGDGKAWRWKGEGEHLTSSTEDNNINKSSTPQRHRSLSLAQHLSQETLARRVSFDIPKRASSAVEPFLV